MSSWSTLFGTAQPVIGMIHVAALPGTPAHRLPLPAIIEQAVAEAQLYQAAGIDALLLENMHDVPYLPGQVGPEITAAMAVIGRAVKAATGLPCGLQILAAANREALAAALAAGLDFIRAEAFVFGHVADEGWLDAQAGALLRYRRQIGADHIRIFTDIKKKHSAHAVTADVDLVETAKAAAFFRSDGLILTGTATGEPTDPAAVAAVRAAVDMPLLIGSGVTPGQVPALLPHVDGLIVGSYVKRDGHWQQPPDPQRIRALMAAVHAAR